MMEIQFPANVLAATAKDFANACNRYRDELGNSQAVAIRRGVINLVQSLRRQTPKAKKQAPSDHIRRARPSETAFYITPKGHKKKPLPRWVVVRRGGKDKKVYFKPSHPKDGDTPVKTKAEARRKWGQYTRWGLAKKSWGWFMHSLFKRNNPESGNPNAKIDDRMTEGYLREVVTGTNPRVECLIVNKLNYINDILPGHAVEAAMILATRSINAQIENGFAKARKELD